MTRTVLRMRVDGLTHVIRSSLNLVIGG